MADQRGGRMLRGYDGHQFAFVGEVERVEAEQFAGTGHLHVHRSRILFDDESELARPRVLVEHGRQPATGRVAQAAHLGTASTSPLSAAQSDSIGVSKARPARSAITAMPWSPSVSDSSTASPPGHRRPAARALRRPCRRPRARAQSRRAPQGTHPASPRRYRVEDRPSPILRVRQALPSWCELPPGRTRSVALDQAQS